MGQETCLGNKMTALGDKMTALGDKRPALGDKRPALWDNWFVLGRRALFDKLTILTRSRQCHVRMSTLR